MKRFVFLSLFCAASLMAMPQSHGPRDHHHEHGNRGGHHPVEQRHHRNCASGEQMHMVMHVLGNQSFDDKRLEVAELSVMLGQFCVSDLAQIAGTFTFDDKRLEFLKFAYSYCVDAENYPMLRNCFTFESNYNSLMEYVYPGWRR